MNSATDDSCSREAWALRAILRSFLDGKDESLVNGVWDELFHGDELTAAEIADRYSLSPLTLGQNAGWFQSVLMATCKVEKIDPVSLVEGLGVTEEFAGWIRGAEYGRTANQRIWRVG